MDSYPFALLTVALFLGLSVGYQIGQVRRPKSKEEPSPDIIDEIHTRIIQFSKSWKTWNKKNKETELDYLITFLESWLAICIDRQHDIKRKLRSPTPHNDDVTYLKKMNQQMTTVIQLCKLSIETFQHYEVIFQADLDDQLDKCEDFIAQIKRKNKSS